MKSLMQYLDRSVTSYHAVATTVTQLQKHGYTPLNEDEPWQALIPGGRYYVKRDEGSVIAFHLPRKASSSLKKEGYFHIWAAHTDSPGLRINTGGFFEKEGYLQASVEVYGGPLLQTWLDRELKAAGIVWVRDGKTTSKAKNPPALEGSLVEITDPLMYIPNLAIHLSRNGKGEKREFDLSRELIPIVGLTSKKKTQTFEEILAQKVGVKKENLLSYELFLVDNEKAGVSGIEGVFLHSGRLDNLAMCHAGLEGFLQAQKKATKGISVLALFNHEEIGSLSNAGASSSFLRDTLRRLHMRLHMNASMNDTQESFLTCLHRSFLISADMANAVHPNVPEVHEERYKTALNQGPVIKLNAKRRYVTSSLSEAFCRAIAQEVQVPLQRSILRTDIPGGSTIGPILASKLGIQTLDIGNAMLSMHSVRETMGLKDHAWMITLAEAFFSFCKPHLHQAHVIPKEGLEPS